MLQEPADELHDRVVVLDGQKLGLEPGLPLLAVRRLALRAVAILA